MKEPTTIRGYLNMMRRVANVQTHHLKGYDKLTKEEQITLGAISADIDNNVGELENMLEDKQNKKNNGHF